MHPKYVEQSWQSVLTEIATPLTATWAIIRLKAITDKLNTNVATSYAA